MAISRKLETDVSKGEAGIGVSGHQPCCDYVQSAKNVAHIFSPPALAAGGSDSLHSGPRNSDPENSQGGLDCLADPVIRWHLTLVRGGGQTRNLTTIRRWEQEPSLLRY